MAPRAASLPDLLELLISDVSLTVDEPSAPFAFGVSIHRDSEMIELSVCDLPPSADPLAPLVGITAPAEWDAFGLVSTATANSPTESRSVSIGIIVDRSGQLWAAMREGEESPVQLPDGGEGQLLDLCKRVLGLDTAPACDHHIRHTIASLWCHRIRALLAARNRTSQNRAPTQPHWDEFAVLHPADELLPESLAPLSIRAEEAIAQLTWAELHQRCCAGTVAIDGLSVTDCRWFDSGSFSRWVGRIIPSWESIHYDVLDEISHDLGFDLQDYIEDLLSGGRDLHQ